MRRFGLIGRTLSHSASKRLFEERFRRESINDCRYDLFELESIELLGQKVLSLPDLAGFNVTIPYKQQIIPLLDGLSFDAECVGAVNCVKVTSDGKLIGYNTDIDGIRASFAELFHNDEQLPKALILGSGGASQAVQYVLAQMGCEYAIVSRSPKRGNMTYHDITADIIGEYQLIINATPIGTYPATEQAPMIPYAYVTPSHTLFDLVYNPAITQFLDYGAQRGARTLNGELMLRVQAKSAWRIWNELE